MKKLILIILIIASLPIRAVGYKADEHNWANSTYAFQPALTCGQYDMRFQSVSQISATNYAAMQEQNNSARHHGNSRRIGRDDLDEDDQAIGEADWRSPIGGAVVPLLLLAMIYLIIRRKKCS